MLYNLSENITKEELKHIKFLLTKQLPRKKLEENVTTLEIFLEMERKDLLSDTNLILLVKIIRQVCPMLEKKIHHFETMKEKVPHMAIVSSGDVQLGTEHSQTQNAQEEALGSYSMMGKQRGFCLIINNNDFSKSLKQLNNRRGTDIDEEGLVKVFTWLGFVTEVARDCTRKQILQVLQKLRIRDHREMDCLVCCVLSHGLERGIYGVDGVEVKLSELQEPFNGHQCSFLKNKPKLFFIQACQGNKEQRPVDIQADCVWHSSVCSDAMVPKDSIPILADFLLGMATVPQFASFRDPTQGTWFIQSLCKNLVHMVPKGCDLVSILTKVNADVSEMTDPGGLRKQMPQPEFSLRKRVVFPIPNDPAPKLFQKQDT
ncbi:caspase-8 [Aplochiton taeniatus]